MTELFLKIEETEQAGDSRFDCYEAICELSKHESATRALLDALIDSTLAEERKWAEIQNRVDFQAKYQTREQAREAFLKEYFHRK